MRDQVITFRASKKNPELVRQLQDLAEKNNRRLNNYIEPVLMEHVRTKAASFTGHYNEKPKVLQPHVFVKPTLQEVRDYCDERQNNIDAGAWFDYHESRGWVINGQGGSRQMDNWKAGIRISEKGLWKNPVKQGQKILTYNQMLKLVETQGKAVWDEYKAIDVGMGQKGWVK
jgi:hypothetical protein